MNERIQTLLAKFKETESTHRGAHVLIGIDEIEKFAELIVGECVDIIANEQRKVEPEWRCKSGHHIWWTIREHFGVEE